jgi:hypothetical protein
MRRRLAGVDTDVVVKTVFVVFDGLAVALAVCDVEHKGYESFSVHFAPAAESAPLQGLARIAFDKRNTSGDLLCQIILDYIGAGTVLGGPGADELTEDDIVNYYPQAFGTGRSTTRGRLIACIRREPAAERGTRFCGMPAIMPPFV